MTNWIFDPLQSTEFVTKHFQQNVCALKFQSTAIAALYPNGKLQQSIGGISLSQLRSSKALKAKAVYARTKSDS